MDLTVDHTEPATVVTVAGRFDAHECAGFRAAVTPLLPDTARTDLDLSGVTFLDSSALAELVRVRKRARMAGSDAVVSAVSDPVRIILELTGLVDALTTPLVGSEPR